MAAAVGSTIGALRVVIGADTTGLQRGLRDTNQGMAGLRRSIVPTVAAVAALGAAFTAVAATMYRMAREEMNVIDSQAQLARAIGGTVNGLRAFKLAAEDMGIDGVEASLNRMNRRLGAAEFGAGAAAVSVKALGLDLQALASMDIQERMASIADSIQASGMSAQQAARHLQNLGFEQRGVSELFMQGGDAIRASTEALDAYGLSVLQLDAARIEEANAQLSRLQLISQGLRTQMAVALAPTLLEIATRLANVSRMAMTTITRIDGLRDASDDLGANQAIVEFARKSGVAIAKVIDFVVLLRNALNAFEGYAKWWGATTIRSITGPFESIVRLGAKMNADLFSDQVEFFDNLKKTQEAGWEQGKKGWDDFFSHIGDGMGAAERGFREAWGQEIPQITDRPGREITDDFNLPVAGGDGASSEDQQAKELAQYREFLTQRLQMLREFTATEQELEIFKHEKNQELLREMFEFEIVTAEEFMELREALEQQHQDRLTDISAKAEQERARDVERWAQFEMQQRAAVVNAAIGLLDQFAGESKAAAIASIALSKGLAIAQIIQSTAAAQMKSMVIDPTGTMAARIGAMGAVQAGIVAATGLAQAASVSSRGTGGLQGGASGSVGGRSSAPSSGGMGTSGGGGGAGPRVNINLIEDRDRAGQVDVNRSDEEEVDVDAFVADIRGGGPRAQALQETFSLRRTGS